MNTKHTPGTWSAYNARGGNIYKNWRVKSSAGRLVATIEEQPIGDEEVHNASLIAAAPELLAAAKTFIAHHKRVCKGEHCQESGIDMLNFAIFKAEGRS